MLIQIIPLYKGENYPMYILELTTVLPLGHRELTSSLKFQDASSNSWRWVYWFHLVRPSVCLRIILHVILRIMAGMRRIGNAEIFAAFSLCYAWNADIMRRFLRIPARILQSAFPLHFFPYKNAEISLRSCPNTPIRIFSARKMRRSGVRDMRYWLFHLFMDSEPNFFICATFAGRFVGIMTYF